MSLTQKQILEISHKLFSTNTSVIIETIGEIRKIGEVQLIEPLIEVADKTKDPEVREAIFSLLADLRMQEAVEPLVIAVNNRKCLKNFPQFLGKLWQNKLDFSAHIPVFLKVMLNENYESGIEAFTIIEESLEHCSHDKLHEVHQQVKDSILKAPEHIKPLFSELLKSVGEYHSE